MYYNKILAKTQEQISCFLGKLFPHFKKTDFRFLNEMLFGIQASGDTELTSIMREINDDPNLKHAVTCQICQKRYTYNR